MNYTYRQLLEALLDLSQDELDMHVTVYDSTNEVYHPLNYTGKCEGDDVVDADHPIMIINDPEEDVSEPEDTREFSDIRSCEIWLEFNDGSTLTTDAVLDMDKCIEAQIRDTFEEDGETMVNFKWKELVI